MSTEMGEMGLAAGVGLAACAYSASSCALHPCLGVAALLVANEHERHPLHIPDAAHNGWVVKASAVTVQLNKLRQQGSQAS